MFSDDVCEMFWDVKQHNSSRCKQLKRLMERKIVLIFQTWPYLTPYIHCRRIGDASCGVTSSDVIFVLHFTTPETRIALSRDAIAFFVFSYLGPLFHTSDTRIDQDFWLNNHFTPSFMSFIDFLDAESIGRKSRPA